MKRKLPVVIPIHEVEPLIRKTILELNRKGYYTTQSCQGHFLRKIGYIHDRLVMDPPSVPFVLFDEKIKLPSVPKGFVESVESCWKSGKPGGFRQKLTRITQKTGHCQIINPLEENRILLKWARALPVKKAHNRVMVELKHGRKMTLAAFDKTKRRKR